MRHGLVLLAILILLAVASQTPGDVELVLLDGQVIGGIDVHRGDGLYTLRLEDGSEIVLPVELVKQVRLLGGGEELGGAPIPEGLGGLRHEGPQTVAGAPIPAGPSGMRHEGPETLAGVQVKAPRTSEQLKVFGKSASFQKDIVDNRWVPESDWDMDPENNNFAPSTWSKGVIDPTWVPESAFDADEDVLENSRSTWQKSIVDSSWQPTDGFARR